MKDCVCAIYEYFVSQKLQIYLPLLQGVCVNVETVILRELWWQVTELSFTFVLVPDTRVECFSLCLRNKVRGPEPCLTLAATVSVAQSNIKCCLPLLLLV
jgi:hypothetical protein